MPWGDRGSEEAAVRVESACAAGVYLVFVSDQRGPSTVPDARLDNLCSPMYLLSIRQQVV